MTRTRRLRAGALVVAWLADELIGEPPTALHPVVLIGTGLDLLGRRLPTSPPLAARTAGGAAWLTAIGTTVATARALERLGARGPGRGWPTLGQGLLLWPLLSGRLLLREVASVEEALSSADLDRARRRVGRLVSRETSTLSATSVRAAALQSLAENLADSWVASVVWYAVGGLPGAAAFRTINTADALWGYRDERWRDAGTVAARADDLAGLLPARLTALLLIPWPGGLRRLALEARRTPSPNGGWPMGAMALRLGVRLPKAGSYVLNGAGREPTPADTATALALAARVIRLSTAIAVTVLTALALPPPDPGPAPPDRPIPHTRPKETPS